MNLELKEFNTHRCVVLVGAVRSTVHLVHAKVKFAEFPLRQLQIFWRHREDGEATDSSQPGHVQDNLSHRKMGTELLFVELIHFRVSDKNLCRVHST